MLEFILGSLVNSSGRVRNGLGTTTEEFLPCIVIECRDWGVATDVCTLILAFAERNNMYLNCHRP